MTWITFGTATSPEQLSQLDVQFNNVAAGMSLPCTAAGTNAISLTPLTSFPSLLSYNQLGGYRFVAVATSTGLVTAQFNGLGFLPVFHQDGVTQASTGDIVINRQYILTFSQALNSGGGGYFLEDPSQPVPGVGSAGQFSPGGRLTLVNSTPAMFSNQTGIQNIFYVPYVHPLVAIYNGTNVQMYNFTPSLSATTGLTLALGGAANFPNGTAFDVFATLISGNPALVAVQWTNTTTRATTLSVFAGFLTNSGSATAQTGPNTSTTLAANQGTFLGSFLCSAQGACQWVFGGAASGGSAGAFNLANYYNTILFNSTVTDSGASYTYNSTTIRQARASAGNQIAVMSTSSERAVIASFNAFLQPSGGGLADFVGIGLNATSGFSVFAEMNSSTNVIAGQMSGIYPFSATGLFTLSRNEKGNANNDTFNQNGADTLSVTAWL